MLDQFLAAPGKMVPGARMPIAVPLAADHADIIAYLSTLRGK
jgi:cytochrome c